MNLVDENNYPLLEGTINLTRSPIDVLVDYIKVRYETNQSFDNLVNTLKEKELAYTAMQEKLIINSYKQGYADGVQTNIEMTS